MVKKVLSRASMEPSLVPPPYPVGEEKTRTSLRHQSLLQDYQDLVKETEAKRKRLLKANQKKLKLLAEVKFLQRRLKSFSKNPSLKTPCRAVKQSCNTATKPARYAHTQNPALPSEVAEAAVPGTNGLLDLNQVSIPDAEELEEWESLRTDRLKMSSVDSSAVTNDLKLSLCRDIGNEGTQASRRKISWQDQLPAKVLNTRMQAFRCPAIIQNLTPC